MIAIARFSGRDTYIGVISMEEKERTIELPVRNIGVSQPASDTDEFGRKIVYDTMGSGVLKLTIEAETSLLFKCNLV